MIKGWAGKPSHPPLTDVSIGAYTAGVAMLILGALGVEEEQMAHGALLAISGGLDPRRADRAQRIELHLNPPIPARGCGS